MNFEEAEKIAGDYGGFVEWTYWRLKPIFWTEYPESILHNSKEDIQAALNLVGKSYHDKGDKVMVDSIQGIQLLLTYFVDDEKAILNSAKNFEKKEWRESMIDLIEKFRQLYGEPEHMARLLGNVSAENINFENLDLSIAYLILNIFATFLTYAHATLNSLYCQKIPESLLPFPKPVIKKAFELHIDTGTTFGRREDIESFNFGKEILEEYIDNKLAISELIKNFSNECSRNSIVMSITLNSVIYK